jgi:hypothetical protein
MIEDMNKGLIELLDQYSTQWDVSPIFMYSTVGVTIKRTPMDS